MLALAQYESEICACGNHISITEDPENNVFTPVERVCPVCAGLDQFARVQHARDEAAEKNAANASPKTPRPSDGRTTRLQPLTPAEVAEARAKRVAKHPDRQS